MVSREIESRMPIAAKLIVRDEPPALMNGRVMPVTGMRPTFIPMLRNDWKKMIPAMLIAIVWPK